MNDQRPGGPQTGPPPSQPLQPPPPPRRPRRPWRSFAGIYVLPVLLVLAGIALPLIRGTETLYLRDVLNAHLEMKWSEARALRQGYFPLIDPYRGGGQPLAGNPNAVPFYPTNVLFLWASPFWALNAHFWIHLLLAPFTFFWMARRWGLAREPAWAAAVCYASSGFFLSHLSFYNLIGGATLAPALVAACLGFAATRGSRRLLHAMAVAAVWALLLLSGDPLMAALAGAMAAAAMLCVLPSWAWREAPAPALPPDSEVVPAALPDPVPPPAPVLPRVRRRPAWGGLALLVGAVALGAVIALPQIVEFLRILPVSFRGFRGYTSDVATIESWDPRQAAEWLLPMVFGRLDVLGGGAFWGRQFFTGAPPFFPSLYPGLLSLALVAASGLPRRRAAARWAWIVAAGAVFISLGRFNPLADWLLLHGSGGSLRYPVKCWLPVAVGTALLCGIGFERLLGAATALAAARAAGRLPSNVDALPPHVDALPPNFEALPPSAEALLPSAEAILPDVEPLPSSAEALPSNTEALPPSAEAHPRKRKAPAPWRQFRTALEVLAVLLGSLWLFLSILRGPAIRVLRLLIGPDKPIQFLFNERLRLSGLCMFSLLLLLLLWVVSGRMARSPRAATIAGGVLLAVHCLAQALLLRAVYPTDAIAPYRVPPPVLAYLPRDVTVFNPDFEHLFGQSSLMSGKFPGPSLLWVERRAFYEAFPFTGPQWDRRYEAFESPEGLDTYLTRIVQGGLKGSTDDERMRQLAAFGVGRLVIERQLPPTTPHARLVTQLPSFGRTFNVYEVTGRAPEIFLARRAWQTPNMTLGYRAIRQAAFDPEGDVVIAGKGGPPRPMGGGTVRVLRQGPESLDLDLDVGPGGSVLVVQRALLMYRATLDGKPLLPHVANLHHNGLPVPAGHHRVRMWIDRTNFHRAVAASAAGVAALLLLTAWGVWNARGPRSDRRRRLVL